MTSKVCQSFHSTMKYTNSNFWKHLEYWNTNIRNFEKKIVDFVCKKLTKLQTGSIMKKKSTFERKKWTWEKATSRPQLETLSQDEQTYSKLLSDVLKLHNYFPIIFALFKFKFFSQCLMPCITIMRKTKKKTKKTTRRDERDCELTSQSSSQLPPDLNKRVVVTVPAGKATH